MLKVSTGYRKKRVTKSGLRQLVDGMVLRLYKGTVPISADDAVNPSDLLAIITKGGLTTPVVKIAKVSFTAVIGEDYFVEVNDIKLVYTVGSGDTEAEISNAFMSFINGIDDIKATASVDGNDDLVITSDTAAVPFKVVSSSGSSSGTTVTTIVTEDAYGLLWDVDETEWAVYKPLGVDWKGTAVITGTFSFFRISGINDTGGESIIEPRIQGTAGLNGDLVTQRSKIYSGQEQDISSPVALLLREV